MQGGMLFPSGAYYFFHTRVCRKQTENKLKYFEELKSFIVNIAK